MAAMTFCIAFTAPAQTSPTESSSGRTAAASSAAPAASSAGSSQTVSAVSNTYQLAPYDVIEVSVYQEEDLHKTVKLGADGTATLPLIGSVQLGGKTVAEAIKIIRDRYASGFVRNPDVLINVIQYRKKTFSILGQVQKPGVFEIGEGQHINIVEAILIGGGFTRIADQHGVTVKRVVNGKQVTRKVDAKSMAVDADAVPFEIQPGDIIYVHESMF